jgi:peptidyl-prolyl cis-trans isomerase D
MPIMTRMRESMPVILFGLLIAFLIMIVFEWGMDYMGMRGGRADVVGKVNGSTITYKEFSELLKNLSDNQKAQSGNDPDDNQQAQLRDQVWQTLVTQRLIGAEIKRLGLTVTDQELVDWVHGDNPPEDLRRNFVDSTGQFRKDLYDQFLANPNQFIRDPKGVDQEFGTRWLADYEKNLRQRRLQEKLQSLIVASVRPTEGEIRQRYIDQNERFDALYALFDANALVKDSAVQVTDAALKEYYNENIDQYKVEASRKLKVVLFNEKPSSADSASRKNEIDDAAAKARSGLDFIQLVYTYSEKPDSGAFFKHGELSPTLETAAFAAAPGAVVGPLLDNDGWHLLKVLGQKASDKEFVRASHILLPLQGQSDTNAVKKEAQSLAAQARSGGDFAALARQYSKDPSNAQNGGELGWFGKGRMVPAFENAAFKARPGEVVGPVRTQFGLHIIKVHGRDSREIKLAHILMKITPSSQTKNDEFERAKDFAYNAKETEFTKEAQQMGFEVKDAPVQEKGGVIPGVGILENATRWAFNNKVGSVSEPYSTPAGYVVLSVAEIKDAGVRPFDEVKESQRFPALRKLKIDKTKQMAADLRAKLGPADSLRKISALDPQIKVQETGPFTLGGSVPMIGRDPNFLGAAAGLQTGQISPPVQSFRGTYLIQLLSRSPFDSTAFASQKEMLNARLLQEKRSKVLSDWLAKLKEDAEIEDNRDMFFR